MVHGIEGILFWWGGALPVMEGDGWVYDVKMPAEKQSITQRIVTKQ